MEEQWTLFELAIKTLDKIDRPLSSENIWEEAEKLGYTKFVTTVSKTPWKAIKSTITSNILKNPSNSIIFVDDSDDDLFSLKSKEYKNLHEIDINNISKEISVKILEKQLHPLLSTFAYSHDKLLCSTKTINASGGEKGLKNFRLWTYPDIVGVHFPKSIHKTAWDIHSLFQGDLIRIYSFELKTYLDYSNLKHSFFQAVSNSNWAHEGYLVTAQINQDKKFKDELKKLSESFGIGIILLNVISIFESEILHPAFRRSNLNHTFINDLVKINKTFNEFMMEVNSSSKNLQLNESFFDPTFDEIEAREYIKKIGII
jgi:uncharacterized protein